MKTWMYWGISAQLWMMMAFYFIANEIWISAIITFLLWGLNTYFGISSMKREHRIDMLDLKMNHIKFESISIKLDRIADTLKPKRRRKK